MTKTTETTRLACRARREKLGLSQTEAARRANMPLTRWWEYEAGLHPAPTLQTIRAVMGALRTKRLSDVL